MVMDLFSRCKVAKTQLITPIMRYTLFSLAIFFSLTPALAGTLHGIDDTKEPCSITLSEARASDAWAIAQVNYIRLPMRLYPVERGFKSLAKTSDMNIELFYSASRGYFVFSAYKKDDDDTWSDFGFTRVCQLHHR